MPVLSSPATVIEAFHLSFLEVLRTRTKSSSYVLKGGANLRYFFGSVRYSEDIDLDLTRGSWSLADQVSEVLESRALQTVLKPVGLAVDAGQSSATKQSETTRRWKVAVVAEGRRDPVRTKIEFSSRNGDERYELEAVPESVVESYAIRPPTVQHYTLVPAIKQKVLALAGRSQTQARDVFDLELLLRRGEFPSGELAAQKLDAAAERGMELTYDAFQDQVAPFLETSVASLYDETSWEKLQHYVVDKLAKESADATG